MLAGVVELAESVGVVLVVVPFAEAVGAPLGAVPVEVVPVPYLGRPDSVGVNTPVLLEGLVLLAGLVV